MIGHLFRPPAVTQRHDDIAREMARRLVTPQTPEDRRAAALVRAYGLGPDPIGAMRKWLAREDRRRRAAGRSAGSKTA